MGCFILLILYNFSGFHFVWSLYKIMVISTISFLSSEFLLLQMCKEMCFEYFRILIWILYYRLWRREEEERWKEGGGNKVSGGEAETHQNSYW